MTAWGLHIYSNIISLVNQTRVDAAGFPWRLAENAESKPSLAIASYAKGTCPVADSRFERSILLAIPSCLTELDEDDIIRTFRKVLGHVSSTGSWTAPKP